MTKQLFLYRPVMKHLDRYTRAGNNGREIMCPNCEHYSTVYHFAWSALTCNNCKQSINKSDYLTEVN